MNPNSVHFYERAWAAYELRQYDLCIDLALEGLRESPGNPYLFLLLSQVELRRDQFSKARYNAKQVIQLAPDDESGYIALAWAVICDSNYSPDQSLKEQARFPARLATARNLLRQAMELSPNNPRHYVLKSELHFLEGDNAAALDSARMGLQYDSSSAGLRRQAIRALSSLGKIDEAYALCLECLRLDPLDNAALYSKAQINLERGDIEIACRDARECVRQQPDNTQYRMLYWDAIKARIWWMRPLIAWQFWLRKLQRLPDAAKLSAIIGGPILLALVVGNLRNERLSEALLGLATISIVTMSMLLVSERPGMALADAFMYVRDPQFRASSDKKQIVINAFIAFYIAGLIGTLGLCALSAAGFPYAHLLSIPFFLLLASLFYLSPIYLLCTSIHFAERIGLVFSVVAISSFLLLGSSALYSSEPNSPDRAAATQYFIAFGFLGVGAPIVCVLLRRRS